MLRRLFFRSCPASLRRGLAVGLGWWMLAAPQPLAASVLKTNDVVVFLGGSAVVAADRAGAVETVLTLGHPGWRLRFRTLAWEGDTVFGRPRELNFPSLADSLRNCQATLVCTQFGSLEALDPGTGIDAFRAAYRQLLDTIASAGPRIVLVIPPAFEPQPPPLPDLTGANERLARIAQATRALAAERQLPLVDLPAALNTLRPPGPWTHDGRELTPAGHQAVAAAWAQQLGLTPLAERASTARLWTRPEVIELRGAVATKNRLWFDYWRPMNWAFLAGDRTEQQASRDHRDPKIRWFPAEMEQYVPLITEADARIESLTAQWRLSP